jgi:uroporphyrinogen-III synthase
MYLLTRPIGQSLILQKKLKRLEIDSFIEPMITIEDNIIKPIKISNESLVIITSPNILDILSNHHIDQSTRIAMVGQASARVAHSLGFNNIIKATKNASELINFIKSEISNDTEIIYLRSDQISFDVKNHLKSRGYSVIEFVLYKSIPAKKLSDQLISMIKIHKIQRILFFSKRTAAIFISLAADAGILDRLSYIEALVMSDAIASELKHMKIIIAKYPSLKAMLGLCK